MFNRKCKITFITHGATINSEENRLSDNESYPPLNDSGEREIEKICEWLKKKGIKNDVIYASPSQRTVQTAELIAKTLKKDFEIIDSLSSRKRGVWSGLTFEQIESKFPHMLEQLHANPTSYFPEGGESITDFNKRISPVIKNIVEDNIGNRIIVVTHNEVVQSAISSALNLPAEHQNKIHIKTGSATQISYFESWASLVYSGYIPL